MIELLPCASYVLCARHFAYGVNLHLCASKFCWAFSGERGISAAHLMMNWPTLSLQTWMIFIFHSRDDWQYRQPSVFAQLRKFIRRKKKSRHRASYSASRGVVYRQVYTANLSVRLCSSGCVRVFVCVCVWGFARWLHDCRPKLPVRGSDSVVRTINQVFFLDSHEADVVLLFRAVSCYSI